jgi:hypothetical protein
MNSRAVILAPGIVSPGKVPVKGAYVGRVAKTMGANAPLEQGSFPATDLAPIRRTRRVTESAICYTLACNLALCELTRRNEAFFLFDGRAK